MADQNVTETIVVERKMAETPFWLNALTNRYNQERQITINETYLPKGNEEGDVAYGRKVVNINIIDVPNVVRAMIKLYHDETGNTIELE